VSKKGDTKKGDTKKGGKKVEDTKKTGRGKFSEIYTVPTRKPTGIRHDQPRRDLTRFVKWPRYIRVQKQRKILLIRLKIPPAIYQFTRTLDRQNAAALLQLANKYRIETPRAKKNRLLRLAKEKAENKEAPENYKKPLTVIAGINAVTRAVETKNAKLVVIAHDVNPIELVVWLPNLCRKMEVPYAIIKGKQRLGPISHTRTCSAIAFTDVHKEDKKLLGTLSETAKEFFNDNVEHRKQWGGGTLGPKRLAAIAKRQKLIAKEIASRSKA